MSQRNAARSLECATLTVDQAAALLGVGRMNVYAQIRAGWMPHLRLGKRIVIPKVALDRLMSCEAALVRLCAKEAAPERG